MTFTEDTPNYCRGYTSKNSPGWDHAERSRAEIGDSRRGGALRN